MLANPKKFFAGFVLMLAFIVVLVLLFLPIYGEGMNALNYLDALYNSISKGSAHYIGDLMAEAEQYRGTSIELKLDLGDEVHAAETARLFEQAGATAIVEGAELSVSGDLGAILERCLEDSEEMFNNNGAGVQARYGTGEKRAMYNWWKALKEVDMDLKRQSRFALADFVYDTKKKAVECAYNYYGVEPQKITERIGLVLFSLVFYVIYTVWYGYAIIFMFEGWGLRLSH